MARQARAARKQPALSDGARVKQAEKLFVRGLVDTCPRCGFEAAPGMSGEDLAAHLAQCNDPKAHAAHQKEVAAAAAKAEAKAGIKHAEEEAQNLMAWQYLGGSTEQMWLLTDTQLKKQVEERGIASVDAGASREELLVALSQEQRQREEQQRAGSHARLTSNASAAASAGGGSSSSSGSGGGGAGKRARTDGAAPPAPRLCAESLPSNLHSLSLSQLKSVCASHGMIAKGGSTAEVIAEIEAALYKGTDAAPLLLESSAPKPSARATGGAAKPGGRKKPVKEDDDSSDEEVAADDVMSAEESEDDVPLAKRKSKAKAK